MYNYLRETKENTIRKTLAFCIIFLCYLQIYKTCKLGFSFSRHVKGERREWGAARVNRAIARGRQGSFIFLRECGVGAV